MKLYFLMDHVSYKGIIEVKITINHGIKKNSPRQANKTNLCNVGPIKIIIYV